MGSLGEPAETVTVSVGLVTLCETRRFPRGHFPKPQERKDFTQVNPPDIGAYPSRYLSVM